MKKFFFVLLILILVFVSSVALARPPEREGYWGDYARAPSPHRLYGLGFGTDPAILEDGQDRQVLIRWGELFQVKCNGAQSDDVTVLCLTMSQTSTPSWGIGGTGVCDESCGQYDDSAGPSGIEDTLPCFTVDNGQEEWRKASLGSFFSSSGATAPTAREGRCTAGAVLTAGNGGAPCYIDAECGAAGICTLDGQRPSGAYLIARSSDANTVCRIEFGL